MTLDFSKLRQRVTIKDVLSQISEEQIYLKFSSEFPAKLCKSPLRIDRTPSFGWYYEDGKWKWKDLGGSKEGGDVFDFAWKYLVRIQNESIPDLASLLIRLVEIFNLEVDFTANVIQQLDAAKQRAAGPKKVIKIVRKPWTYEELQIWKRWAIEAPVLDYYRVYSTKHVFCDDLLYWRTRPVDPIFSFHFPRTDHIKSYRPLTENKKNKFLGNATNELDVQGYDQLRIKERRPKLLIMTKAMKEVMFFRSFGIDAIAGHSESSYFDPDFIRHLKKYCHRIVTLYDNDNTGVSGAWMMRDLHDIPAMFVPRELKVKNITDLWERSPQESYKLLEEFKTWISKPLFKTHYSKILR